MAKKGRTQMAENSEKKIAKAVYVIREFGEKQTNWVKVGVAFVNRDGSLNLQLDALPVDGKLHVRDFKEKDPGKPATNQA
jgi:hypothetical protein